MASAVEELPTPAIRGILVLEFANAENFCPFIFIQVADSPVVPTRTMPSVPAFSMKTQ